MDQKSQNDRHVSKGLYIGGGAWGEGRTLSSLQQKQWEEDSAIPQGFLEPHLVHFEKLLLKGEKVHKPFHKAQTDCHTGPFIRGLDKTVRNARGHMFLRPWTPAGTGWIEWWEVIASRCTMSLSTGS